MANCSMYWNKKFMKSIAGILKVVEIVFGLGCWTLLCFGDAFRTRNDIPEINGEVILVMLTSFLSWIITCTSYILLLKMPPSKRLQRVEVFLNTTMAAVFAASTCVCASSRDFVWLCIDDVSNEVIPGKYCDLPHYRVLRNNGQNVCLTLLTAVLFGLYFTHAIYIFTKMLTNKYLLSDTGGLEFDPIQV